MITRRLALSGLLATALAHSNKAQAQRLPAELWANKLITAAERQVGVTLSYDPAYRRLTYPGGDVPREIGVCTDVIIRAYRDAFGIDLQEQVHTDMKRSFSAYPKIWGMAGTDSNIDHRRVPNLRTFLTRKGAERPVSQSAADYQPGDIVTQNLPGNLAHIVLVSNPLGPL